MKITRQVVAPIAIVALNYLGCTSAAKHVVDVGTCAELQRAAALAATSGDTNAVLTAEGIACDEWTTFEVKNHRVKIVAQEGGPLDENNVYAFEKVRFLVSSGGVLRADVALSFATGEEYSAQEVDGGVLHVAEGGYARFGSDVFMNSVTIHGVTDDGTDITPDRWYGGCIYNQGKVRFEGDFQADDCATLGGGESAAGNGAGVFNGETGDITFKGDVEMTNCGTLENEGNKGGAIYNEGKISMFSAANFFDNRSSAGGAICNKGVFKFLKNALATFRGNRSSEDAGGQVSNSGSISFKGGVVFEDGFSESNAGAIANTETVIIQKSAVFKNNVATSNGGAISSPSYATFVLPDNTKFKGNYVRYTFWEWENCDNWYQRTSEDNFDYVCLEE